MPGKNEKTWQTDGNILVSRPTADDCAKEVLWNMVALLTGKIGTPGRQGLWTVVGSSDAVTAGLDGVDRWGATFDPAKLIHRTRGEARSWIVLRSPDSLGPHYVGFDYTSNGTNNHALDMYVGDVPPSAGTTTGFSGMVGWSMLSGSGVNPFVENVAAAFRCNLILATTGEFWFTVAKGGAYQTVIGVQRTDRALDPYNVVGCFAHTTIAATGGPFGSATNASPLMNPTISQRAFKGKLPGANTVSEFFGLWVTAISNSSLSGFSVWGKNPDDGTYPEIPLYLHNGTVGGFKGRIPDAYITVSNCPEGAVAVDGDGKIYSSCVSDAWLPWTADYTPIL